MKPGFTSEADAQRGLMCRMPGCRNVWTCDVLFGKVCSQHDAELAKSHSRRPPRQQPQPGQQTLPAMTTLREAARPFAEPAERDEEASPW